MDRYTEDLKYSLRRSLSDSVGKGCLRTNDILARSHRQIVADFTDPKQWYYSTTHDYIISILRQSQKYQTGGPLSKRGRLSESRKEGRRVLVTPNRYSSPSTPRTNSRPPKSRGSLPDIPTETSQDLIEIRGQTAVGTAVKTQANDGELTANSKKHLLNTSSRLGNSLSQHDKVETYQQGEEGLSIMDAKGVVLHGQIYPHGHTLHREDGGDEGSDATMTLFSAETISSDVATKTDEHHGDNASNDTKHALRNTGVEQCDLEAKSEAVERVSNSSSVRTRQTSLSSEDYDKSHMETYKASKQNRLHTVPVSKYIAPASAALHPSSSIPPGNLNSFRPLAERKKRANKDKEGHLPSIWNGSQKSSKPSGRNDVMQKKAGKRQSKFGMLAYPGSLHGQKDADPFVEDWIQKLNLDGKNQTELHDAKAGGRLAGSFPKIDSHIREHSSETSKQSYAMPLPDDFQPVGQFQPFQPFASLYLYTLKQKSNLNLKMKYLQVSRPGKQPVDSTELIHPFVEDLKITRSKMDQIENQLGQLYQTETNLVGIVARQKTSKNKKKSPKTNNDSYDFLVSNSISMDTKRRAAKRIDEETPRLLKSTLVKERNGEQPDGDQQKAFLTDAGPVYRDDKQSKPNVVRLALPSRESAFSELPGEKDLRGPRASSSSGTEYRATSTSSWKETPPSSAMSRDVKVVERKLLSLFDDNCRNTHSMSTGDTQTRSDIIHPRTGEDEDHRVPITTPENTEEHVGHSDVDSIRSDSMLTTVVDEVIRNLVDQVDSSEDSSDHASSMDTKTTELEDRLSEHDGQSGGLVERQCSFCDEPHDIRPQSTSKEITHSSC